MPPPPPKRGPLRGCWETKVGHGQSERKGSRGGIDHMSQATAKTVQAANVMLQVSLSMLVAAVLAGTAALLENPALLKYHMEVGDTSRWRLPQVVRLSNTDVVALHKVWQGPPGAVSPKPTFFISVGLPTFKARVRKLSTIPMPTVRL